MFKIGFEIECVSPVSERTVEKKLIYVDPSADVKDDGSIATTSSHPNSIEIVTIPLPPKRAFSNLKKIFSFMKDNNLRTNYTCGLHVNISMKKELMRKLNPEKLIAATDDLYIASVYKRANNEYCRPWKYYVNRLANSVESYNKRDGYHKTSLRAEFSKMIRQVYNDDWGNDDLPSTKVGDEISSKNTAINIMYLKEYQYVEYRMLGGQGYERHFDKIEEAADHFMLGQMIAVNEKSDDRINSYLEWCK